MNDFAEKQKGIAGILRTALLLFLMTFCVSCRQARSYAVYVPSTQQEKRGFFVTTESDSRKCLFLSERVNEWAGSHYTRSFDGSRIFLVNSRLRNEGEEVFSTLELSENETVIKRIPNGSKWIAAEQEWPFTRLRRAHNLTIPAFFDSNRRLNLDYLRADLIDPSREFIVADGGRYIFAQSLNELEYASLEENFEWVRVDLSPHGGKVIRVIEVVDGFVMVLDSVVSDGKYTYTYLDLLHLDRSTGTVEKIFLKPFHNQKFLVFYDVSYDMRWFAVGEIVDAPLRSTLYLFTTEDESLYDVGSPGSDCVYFSGLMDFSGIARGLGAPTGSIR